MKKITPNDQESHSVDIAEENVRRLREALPGSVVEGPEGWVVDVDTLKALVGDRTVVGKEERFGLTWHGKRRSLLQSLTPSTGTLRPCPEQSRRWEETQNLIIAGDNLEALKLLQKSYARRIKAIYIDPPYNTGRNLIYQNNFVDGMRAYLEVTGQRNEGVALTSNPSASGRFHANWLSMIFPRLRLARSLLAHDGVLVCTIDDNEVSQLGVMLREVFEEGNYEHVCVPIVHNPRGVQGKNFSYVHEYAYFVFPSGIKAISDRKIGEAEVQWSQFRNWGGESLRSDAKNCFYPVIVRNGRIVGFGDVCPDDFHPDQTEIRNGTAHVYPIDRSGTERKWRYARQSVDEVASMLRARKIEDGYEIEIGKTFGLLRSLWNDKRHDANEYGTRVVSELVPDSPFTFPKSLWAVYDCLLAATADDPDAIILDFFAGSGTTAHAVMELNRNLGGERKFILVQLPEAISTDEQFSTIFDVTLERVRAAAEQIESVGGAPSGDYGFRVFRLDSSNIREWDPSAADLERSLFDAVDHIKVDRSEQDVLYEVLLKFGIDLCVPIKNRAIAGKTVHSIGAGTLLVCLTEEVAPNQVEELALGIADWCDEMNAAGETTVVFRDSAFVDDVAKTNASAILEQRGIDNVRSL